MEHRQRDGYESNVCNARAFNQDLDGWDTGKVTIMSSMFYGASAFNGNIGSWNTANVTLMNLMFFGASAFNREYRQLGHRQSDQYESNVQ